MVSPETLKKAKYSALMLAGATIDLGNDKDLSASKRAEESLRNK